MPLDRSSTPRLAPSCDVRRLPLGPIEGFVLSRIDGTLPISEIASVTGRPVEEVSSIVTKLADLGAVVVDGYVPTPPAAPPPPPVESNEIPGEIARRIDELFPRLEEIDHYMLLGVARSADRKAVKSAYYALASTFHTDRYFGKNLGAYKPKMERIFGHLTIAHDTLASAAARAEYDAYLGGREQLLADERALFADADGLELTGDLDALTIEERPVSEGNVRRVDSSARFRAVESPPAPKAPSESSQQPAQQPSAVSPSGMPLTPEQDRQRREALARRLTSNRRMPAVRSSNPAAPPTPSMSPPRRTTTPAPNSPSGASLPPSSPMRRAPMDPRAARVAKHRAAADAAMAADDVVTAARELRLAMQFSDDPALKNLHEETERKARAKLVDQYVASARYEAQEGRWALAALSWAKAHDGRPEDADIAAAAADAIRKSAGDLHRAARFAQSAVQLKPNVGLYRRVLGEIYLDAGLFLRARTELEHAVKLSPSDTIAKELLARARKAAS